MEDQASTTQEAMSNDKKPIKHSTRAKYEAVYTSYKARFTLEEDIDQQEDFPWRDFAMWVISTVESHDFSDRYRNLIRAAIMHQIREESQSDAAMSAIRIIEEWEIDRVKDDGERRPENKRRSRESRRMIPKEDWSSLINYFNMHPSKWGVRAQNMISASIGCGARPVEWIYAHLVDDSTIRIYNAKIKNINAWNRVKPGLFFEGSKDMAEYRMEADKILEEKIRLSGLDPIKDIDLIMEIRRNASHFDQRVFRDVEFESQFLLPIRMTLRHIDHFFREKIGPQWRDQPADVLEPLYKKDFYAKIRVSIWRACRSLFGTEKLYSPADARSTFAANRKARYGIERTATDMGHSSTSKTRSNYAAARKAWST